MSSLSRFVITILALVVFTIVGSTAFADSAQIDGFTYRDVRVTGMRDGQLVVVLSSGKELVAPCSKVDSMTLDDYPRFNDAEAAMAAKDFKKAANTYVDALPTVKDPKLVRVVQARSIGAFDKSDRWTEAVSTFLNLYRVFPTPATFELHPTKLPADSRLLADSANLVSNQLIDPTFKSPEAQKSLKTFLLRIYNKMGDPRATVLAKDLSTDAAGLAMHAPDSASQPASRPTSPSATAPAAAVATTRAAPPIVYLLDHAGHALDTFGFLQKAVNQSIERLSPDQTFALIVFAGEQEGARMLTPGATLATAEAKRAAIMKLNQVVSNGRNDDEAAPFIDAFRKAFALKPAVIYFVDADSSITDPKVIEAVRNFNNKKATKISVNTIVSGTRPVDALKQIALDSGGTFKVITAKDLDFPLQPITPETTWTATPVATRPGPPPVAQLASGNKMLFELVGAAKSILDEQPPFDATTLQQQSFQDKKKDKIKTLVRQTKDQLATNPVEFAVYDVMPGPSPKVFEVKGIIETEDASFTLRLITRDTAAEGWSRGQQFRLILPAPVALDCDTSGGSVKISVSAGK